MLHVKWVGANAAGGKQRGKRLGAFVFFFLLKKKTREWASTSWLIEGGNSAGGMKTYLSGINARGVFLKFFSLPWVFFFLLGLVSCAVGAGYL